MAEKLLHEFKTRVGELALVPSGGGAFEVSLDGEKVYSKLETGRFPKERELLKEMDAKM